MGSPFNTLRATARRPCELSFFAAFQRLHIQIDIAAPNRTPTVNPASSALSKRAEEPTSSNPNSNPAGTPMINAVHSRP